MRWEKNVRPEYFWYNGSIETLTARDKVDPSSVIAVNRPLGEQSDPNARIFPFKAHRGKQPMDAKTKNLVIPQLFGSKKSDAYWKHYDWNRAVATGMNKAGLPFSGELAFAEISYVFPITHMVDPKDNSVACAECHTRDDGRMSAANLTSFYMPRRDTGGPLKSSGWAIVLATLVGVVGHGVLRLLAKRKG